MVAATQTDNKVVTGKVRLSYANLFEPRSIDGKAEAKYGCTLIIDKGDTKTLAAMKAAAAVAAENGKAKLGKAPKELLTTLHDGDEEADLERNPEYEGAYYIAVSSKTKPGLVDREKDFITDPSELYSGCYVRAQIAASAYNTSGNKGISFYVNHVQKLEDGDPLGGITRAEDAFDDLDDDEEESVI